MVRESEATESNSAFASQIEEFRRIPFAIGLVGCLLVSCGQPEGQTEPVAQEILGEEVDEGNSNAFPHATDDASPEIEAAVTFTGSISEDRSTPEAEKGSVLKGSVADETAQAAERIKALVAERLPDFTGWNSVQFKEFYYERIAEIPEAELDTFERLVLGEWCEADVENCFRSLEENFEEEAAWGAKRNAAAGWAERNWVAAYEWYQVSGGDVGGLAKLGGDATGLIEVVFRKMAEVDPEEASGAVKYLIDEGSREALRRPRTSPDSAPANSLRSQTSASSGEIRGETPCTTTAN